MDGGDIITSLKQEPFSWRKFSEKKLIIQNDRPMPVLKCKTGNRSFQQKWYGKFEWLCGSVEFQKLFCWPCLLFQPKLSQSWTDHGYSSMKNLTTDSLIHARSSSHLCNFKAWKTFVLVNLETSLNKFYEIEREIHNKKVDGNRAYLKNLINAVLYLSKQELAFCCDDESKDSLNKGNYSELLSYFALLDSAFAGRLSTKEGFSQFPGLSNTIQNELTTSIDKVIGNEIHSDIENATFLSIQAHETTDCSTKCQLSIIIRYVLGYEIKERFYGFVEVSSDRSANDLVQSIEKCLASFTDVKNKLVSQSYNGAVLMTDQLNKVQSKFRINGYKYAHLIHCYAYPLSLVIVSVVQQLSGVKSFFSHLCAFSKYSSASTKRKDFFNFLELYIPSLLCETRCCYYSRMISAIFDQHAKLKEAFESILSDKRSWDDESLTQAENLLTNLNSFSFMFYTCCFKEILGYADKLFEVLHCRVLDMEFAKKRIVEFIKFLEALKNDFAYNKFIEPTLTLMKLSHVPPPEKKLKSGQTDLKESYFSILDTILTLLAETFENIEEFSFIELLNTSKFSTYRKQFPLGYLKNLIQKYNGIFEEKALFSELKYIYNDSDFYACKNVREMLKLCIDLGLEKAFKESAKLFRLILTIPVSSASSERSFSTLNRIKTYLRKNVDKEGFQCLARIVIEKEILVSLEKQKLLNDKVIEEYALKQRRLELIYK